MCTLHVSINDQKMTLRNYRLTSDPNVYGYVSECFQTLVNMNDDVRIDITLKTTYPGDYYSASGSGFFNKAYNEGGSWSVFLPYGAYDGTVVLGIFPGPYGAHIYERKRK